VRALFYAALKGLAVSFEKLLRIIDERNPRFKQYTVTSHDLLAAYAKRAFCEYTPIRFNAHDPERIYRAFHYGPSLDIFMLDERSYRGPNSENRQETPSAETAFLGTSQVQWLKRALLNSRATVNRRITFRV